MENMTSGQMPQISRYPNYYGSSSPDPHYRMTRCGRVSLNDANRLVAYSNYGYHPEMQEVENAYVVPRVCLENPEGSRISINREPKHEVCYAQPRCQGKQKIVFRDNKDCIETDVYVEGARLSSHKSGPNENYPSRCTSPRLYQSEETIREEEEDRDVTRITRL